MRVRERRLGKPQDRDEESTKRRWPILGGQGRPTGNSHPEPPNGPPALAPSASQAFVVLDATGRVLQLDTPDPVIPELAVAGAVGQTIEALGPAPPWSTVAEIARRVHSTRAPAFVSVPGPTGGGAWDVSATLLAGEDGPEDRIVITIRGPATGTAGSDGSRHRRLQAGLGSLANGVAETIRSPLFNLSATVDALEVRFGKQNGHGRYVSVLRGELQRISRFVGELLEFGTAHDPGQRQVCFLHGIVAQAAFRNRLLARKSDVRVVNEVAAGVADVNVDRRRVVAVLQRLLEDAIRHAPSGSAVIIRAERAGDWVDCSVEDSGPGFRPQDLPRIFEPFFDRQRGEAGLGLAIVRRLVEAHEGRILAAVGAQGGTILTLRLPVHVQDLDGSSSP